MTQHRGTPTEEEYLDDLLGRGLGDGDQFGYPGQVKYIGTDKAVVVHYKDYESMARGFNYPFDEDIDYDPRIDNLDEEQ